MVPAPTRARTSSARRREVTILGNHDAAVAGRMDYSYYYEAARQALDLHAQQLTRGEPGLAPSRCPTGTTCKEYGVTLCHGSPVRLEEFEYIFAREQARECLPILDELGDLTLIGHSHLCKVFAMREGEVEELPGPEIPAQERAGSTSSASAPSGQPRDYDNRASYTIFDTETREFEFKRVEYDIETAAMKIFEGNLERNFGHRLFIGV